MNINKDKIFELMDNYADGNYNKFSRILGINVGHLHRTLNIESKKAGSVFLGAIINFCEKNNLDFKDYIFLDDALTVCNTMTRINNSEVK